MQIHRRTLMLGLLTMALRHDLETHAEATDKPLVTVHRSPT
jgi:hypothetical protein